jgi:4-amino-4-deoxychorismate lyase
VSLFRSWTLVDGAFREGAAVPISDRGFRYGMSVFETMAVRSGNILFLEQHLAALESACLQAGFQADITSKMVVFGELPDGLLRIYVTAGDGSSSALASGCRTFAFFEPAEFPRVEDTIQGIRIGISPEARVPTLGGCKTGNYWPHVRALASARERGFDEVLILNTQGAVISASMANVFFGFGSQLRTPAPRLGARRGVVRTWIEQMTQVDDSFLLVDEIEGADECFLTNSRLGVMPVAEIEGRRLPSRAKGAALARLYREKVLRV